MGNHRTRARNYDRKRDDGQLGQHTREQTRLSEQRREEARRRYAERRAANVETARNSGDEPREPRVSRSDRTIWRMIKSTVDHVRNMIDEDAELECRLLSGLVNHHSMVTARKASSVLSEKE
ncbi:hypothetical protein R1flu_004135 [Riccia fluitans]|uniref:Uncharacterized protein n=1 Tax=Riccia fluitans TaxID=41844 RepID=A0ABD1YPE9_9MARC